MAHIRIFVPLSILACLIGGCGPGAGKTVKEGDIVVTQEVLRETAETQWEDSHVDGFTFEIPKGTHLKVLYTPAATVSVFVCRPVEVNGEKDPDMVEAFFVPEPVKNKMGYTSYSFALKKEYLGSKVKKLE
ncbi:MAG: hypothetical protein JXA18_08695 [Chitinispirillaceae bacterium]|nr:hypothetical protein [Chitinispirillaceae bacterium]